MHRIYILFLPILLIFSTLFSQDIKLLTEEIGTQKISEVIKINDDNYFLLYNEIYSNGISRLKFKFFSFNNESSEAMYLTPDIYANQTEAKAIQIKPGLIAIAWIDSRREKDGDIYIQLVDNSGILWDSIGQQLTFNATKKSNLEISGDKAGNIFIAWNETIDGHYKNIFVQKLNLFGEESFKKGGLQVFISKGIYDNPSIVADEEGGFYLGYTDKNNLIYQIYVQRFSSQGAKLFGQFGKFISNPATTSDFVSLFLVKNEGLFAFWTSFDKYQKIFAQKISDKGIEEWSDGGEIISQLPFNQLNPSYYFDENYFIILFNIINDKEKSIYIQKFGLDGLPDFTNKGFKVCNYYNEQVKPEFIKYKNNLLVYFLDSEPGSRTFNLFGQLLTEDGISIFSEGKIKFIESDFNNLFKIKIKPKNGSLISIVEKYFGTSLNIFQINFNLEQESKFKKTFRIHPLNLTYDGSFVRLWWISENNSMNNYMWIERRYENENWKEVAAITTEHTKEKNFHSYEDKLTINGNYEYRIKYISQDGRIAFSESQKVYHTGQSEEKNLLQNSPNPFNSSTKIMFKLTEPSNVKLTIFNSRAEEVMELVRGYYSAGVHEVTFTAPDNLASGIYFYKLETKNFVDVKKMVYAK